MGSVSSTTSNLSLLLQTLSADSPQLSSMLATPNMKSALEKATPGDLVQLSDQALQLQQMGLMFGSTDGPHSTGSVLDSLFSILSPGSSNAQPDPILQALESSLGVAGANAGASSSTPSNEVAGSAISFQAQELNALFAATQPADPSLNTLG